MKFKKLMALLCAGLMAVSLAACGGNGGGSDEGTAPAAEDQADEGGEESEESSEKVGGTHIYVLTAAEDHGWTGSGPEVCDNEQHSQSCSSLPVFWLKSLCRRWT